jgi:hypothetical protein
VSDAQGSLCNLLMEPIPAICLSSTWKYLHMKKPLEIYIFVFVFGNIGIHSYFIIVIAFGPPINFWGFCYEHARAPVNSLILV